MQSNLLLLSNHYRKKVGIYCIYSFIAVGIFFAVTVSLFYADFFEHKTLEQPHQLYQQAVTKEIRDYITLHNQPPKWCRNLHTGIPAYHLSYYYRVYQQPLLSKLIRLLQAFLPSYYGNYFAAMFCFYIFLLCSNMKPLLSIIGGLSYGLLTMTLQTLLIGDNQQLATRAFFPLLLAGLHLLYHQKKLGFLLASLGFILHVHYSCLSMTYYYLFILIPYFAYQGYRDFSKLQSKSFFQFILQIFCPFLISLLLNSGNLYEQTKCLRDTSFFKPLSSLPHHHSYLEAFDLIIPNFSGGSHYLSFPDHSMLTRIMNAQIDIPEQAVHEFTQNVPSYWGGRKQIHAPYYFGIVLYFFCLLGIFILPLIQTLWLLIPTGILMLFFYGNLLPFPNHFLYSFLAFLFYKVDTNYLPLIFSFLLLLFSLFSISHLVYKPKDFNLSKKVLYALLFASLLPLISIVLSWILSLESAADSELPTPLLCALKLDRRYLLQKDAFRALVYIYFIFLTTWFWLKDYLSRRCFLGLILVYILFDYSSIYVRYMKLKDFKKPAECTFFSPTSADQRIHKLSKQSGYRVVDLEKSIHNPRISYHHASLGGWGVEPTFRYQAVFNRYIQHEYTLLKHHIQHSSPTHRISTPLLNMLNTKYFLINAYTKGVITNHHAWGHAWFARKIIAASTEQKELQLLETLSGKESVILNLNQHSLSQQKFSNQGHIQLLTYQTDQMSYNVETDAISLIVFSEMYDPQIWTAYLNQKKIPFLRVNYLLTGLLLPPGKHYIEFVANPSTYYPVIQKWMYRFEYIFCLLVLLGCILIGRFYFNEFKRISI